MNKKLIIKLDECSKNIFTASKVATDSLYIPVDVIDFEEITDVWSGFNLYAKYRRYLLNITKGYDDIIFIAERISLKMEGFLYNCSKSLKRRRKNVKLITNFNGASQGFTIAINKYCNVKNVYTDAEYKDFYEKHFPKVSLIELEGILVTIFIREIEKCA